MTIQNNRFRKLDSKKKKKSMQKKIKEKQQQLLQTRARKIDFENNEYDDDLNCETCPHREACKKGEINNCIVKKEKQQDVDWFMPFWNQKRLELHARLSELLLLTHKQIGKLRRRQARYGMDAMRMFVINLMKSDYVNCRDGKRHPSQLDHYLDSRRFPLVVQGRYNDLDPEDRPLTEEERRKLEREQREREQEQRRAEALRIAEKDREAQRRQREYDAAHAARGKELQAIFDELDKQMAEYGGGRDLEKNIKNTACEG